MSEKKSRRDFFRGGWRNLFSGSPSSNATSDAQVSEAKPRTIPPFLRPPGALDEQNFLATCDRSGQCVTACHQDSILPLTIPFGPDLVGTPAIIPEIRACFVCDDVPCVYACPSGALAKITVAELRLGTAVLDQSRCLVTAGESCSACIDACPKPGDAIFATDATVSPIINPSSCTGCGMCVPACPVQPGAIRVHPAWAIEV